MTKLSGTSEQSRDEEYQEPSSSEDESSDEVDNSDEQEPIVVSPSPLSKIEEGSEDSSDVDMKPNKDTSTHKAAPTDMLPSSPSVPTTDFLTTPKHSDTSPQGHKVSEKPPLRVGTAKMGSKTQRPTMSVAMATKQQISLQNISVANKELIKQQLKDMRYHVQKQLAELERLKARNKETLTTLQKKHSGRESRHRDKANVLILKQKRLFETETSVLQKRFSDDLRQVAKDRDTKEKHLSKDISQLGKEMANEFKKEDKVIHKAELQIHCDEMKSEKIKEKSLKKKERIAVAKLRKEESEEWLKHLKYNHEQRLLRYKQLLRQEQFAQDYTTIKLQTLYELQLKEAAHFREATILELNQREQTYKTRVDLEMERSKLEMEHLQQEHPLAIQQLKKEQELEQKHLIKTQLVEKDQQCELLSLDQRIAIRDYKKARQADKKRLERTFKAFKVHNQKKITCRGA